MAKKTKPEYDVDAVVSAINVINDAGILEPLEIDEDNPDNMVDALIGAIDELSDEEVEGLPTSKDILELLDSLPERFFPSEDESETASDDSEGVESEGDPEGDDEVEPEEEPQEKPKKNEKKSPKEKKEFVPECPTFGEYQKGSDECKICKSDYAEEFGKCVEVFEAAKAVKKEEKPEKKSPKKEDKTPAKEEKKVTKKEKEPEEKTKRNEEKAEKTPKKEKEPEPEEKKKSFRAPKQKAKEEAEETTKEKSPRRLKLSSLTGKKVADYFRRISIGGIVNECIVVSTKTELTTTYSNETANIFAQVVSNFAIPYIGTFAIGDISKIIKFAGSVGDGELEIEVTDDRFIMKSHSNKIQLLLSSPETIQTAPGKDEETDEDLNINDVVEATNSSTIISLDTGKDIIFDAKLIKSDKMMVVFEDGELNIVGGDGTSDKFNIGLKTPELGSDPIDRDFQISGQNFAAILGVASLVDLPMELLFSSEDEAPIILRQGEDIWCLDLETSEAE